MFPEYDEKDLFVLTFNLTWLCPVKCSYCYIKKKVSRDEKKVLSEKDLVRECKEGLHYGIKEYRFSGGEPTVLGDKLFAYADIVYDITGQKPILLTSGLRINDRWLNKAENKFSIIAVSLENPLEPLQKVVDSKTILSIIRENVSNNKLPFRYGLTLISANQFKNIEKVFDILVENVDGEFMPQLDYPCLYNYAIPSLNELNDIYKATNNLFSRYNVIPNYFVYLIGSLVWLSKDMLRIVLNLYPDGKYEIYDSLIDRWRIEYKWQNHALSNQKSSTACQNCGWLESCRHHPEGFLRYDWCDLRRAIFDGIYDGLGLK